MSLTPLEIIMPPATNLSDTILTDVLKYLRYNGMLLGYIAILMTVKLIGDI